MKNTIRQMLGLVDVPCIMQQRFGVFFLRWGFFLGGFELFFWFFGLWVFLGQLGFPMEALPSSILGLPPIFSLGRCVHSSSCLNTYSCRSFSGVFSFLFVVEQLGIGRLRQYAIDSFCLRTSNNLSTKHLFKHVHLW